MTGFGRGTAATSDFLATVEASSVNRKQAEIVVLAPREVAELEPRVRQAVLATISRGRVQVVVKLERPEGVPVPVRVDTRLARALDDALRQLSTAVGRTIEPTAADFLRQPGIVALEEPSLDLEGAWLAIEPALAAALAQMTAMRAAEGADLKRDLLERLDGLGNLTRLFREAAPAVPGRQRELLLKRLREAHLDIDPADERVLKELALFADRSDISEELTRLDSHFRKFREALDGSEPAGRSLDFLCQELHREFNTIGSKANDASIAHAVVEAKTGLEKIREQVQNLE